jgi:hypothetical protein
MTNGLYLRLDESWGSGHDPETGNSYSTHREAQRDPAQSHLFDPAPQTAQLSKLLLERFRGQKAVPVSDIFQWVIDETDVFLPTHARTELENLLSNGYITYTDPQATGRKRRAGDWPPRLLITFLE